MAYAPTSNSLNADGGRLSSSKRITITLSHSTYEALVELSAAEARSVSNMVSCSLGASRRASDGHAPAQVLPWGSRAIAAHAYTNRHSFSWYVNSDRWVRLNALGQRYWQSPH
jgi:hypothetical protein